MKAIENLNSWIQDNAWFLEHFYAESTHARREPDQQCSPLAPEPYGSAGSKFLFCQQQDTH